MSRLDSPPVSIRRTKPGPPVPLPKLPQGEKRLDDALLAMMQNRTLEVGVLPGIPFH